MAEDLKTMVGRLQDEISVLQEIDRSSDSEEIKNYKRLRATMPESSRLDAVQGSGEARTELHQQVLLGSTAVADAVMGQESAGLPALPVSRADGEEGWNA